MGGKYNGQTRHTVKEAAKLLSLGQNTVYELIQQKQIGHIRMENTIKPKGGEQSA